MVTTVMLKDEEEKLLEQARNMLIHKGLDSLDSGIRTEIKQVPLGRLTKGTVVALSAIILMYLLEKGELK